MEEEKTSWHLKKEFSYGHILSTVMLGAMMVGGWVEVQTQLIAFKHHLEEPVHAVALERLSSLESRVTRTESQDSAIQLRLEDFQKEILRRLDRQDVKLDRIEERLNAHDTSSSKN